VPYTDNSSTALAAGSPTSYSSSVSSSAGGSQHDGAAAVVIRGSAGGGGRSSASGDGSLRLPRIAKCPREHDGDGAVSRCRGGGRSSASGDGSRIGMWPIESAVLTDSCFTDHLCMIDWRLFMRFKPIPKQVDGIVVRHTKLHAARCPCQSSCEP
jgi:hypothetical protein